ncbi:MAG: molybdenum cofactor biosynthesis protein MoaE [Candidatus Eremiobacteraeota bacterium]|nr:molybdenum cofactor biosynthesis protein MoaE [Candidatus Eremiobacteraeota bacterium]
MFDVVRTQIDIRDLEAAVRDDSYGAAVTFLGIVRDRASDGTAVTGLSYEAYVPMAVHEFACIADEARERFGDLRIAIVHRVGDLAIGEIAVALAAASRHRGVAFDACEFAIDALKSRAPIWKKEHYASGSALWIRNVC